MSSRLIFKFSNLPIDKSATKNPLCINSAGFNFTYFLKSDATSFGPDSYRDCRLSELKNLLLLFFLWLFAFAFAGNNFYFVAFFVVVDFHCIAFAQFAF
jgi:hypothetical protein